MLRSILLAIGLCLVANIARADTPLISVEPTVVVVRQGECAVMVRSKDGYSGVAADLTQSTLVIAEALPNPDRFLRSAEGITLQYRQVVTQQDVERCNALLAQRYATMQFDSLVRWTDSSTDAKVPPADVRVDVSERRPRMVRVVFRNLGMDPRIREAYMHRWREQHADAHIQLMFIRTKDGILTEALALSDKDFRVSEELSAPSDLPDWSRRAVYMLNFGA